MDSSTFSLITSLATLLFLIGSFLLTSVSTAFRQLYHGQTARATKVLGKTFFYQMIHRFFFPQREAEGLFFAIICTQGILKVLYALSFALFFGWIAVAFGYSWPVVSLGIIAFLIFSIWSIEILPRIIGMRYPVDTMRYCGLFSSFFMLLSFPVTFLFLKFSRKLTQAIYFEKMEEPEGQVKQEIIEIIHQAGRSTRLEADDKELIESVVDFRDRVAREVMVPRVDLFSLSADTSIREAAKLLQAEGYSRTPVYRNNIDTIVGVLMYKDILNKYMEYESQGQKDSILDAPIETIVKGALYTPETKKISQLLQEFRKKQVHLAIVVDEYGGTEGIVTIEDILEEIVGEIADEYDEKEALIMPQADGSWLIDARLNIWDAEEMIGIKIPQEGDYDTIGGYIFHRTGSIPPKGAIIHHEEFEMEITNSNDRCVEQVRISRVTA